MAPRPLPCKLHSCLAAWLPGWGGEHSYKDGQNSFPVNERVTIKEICLNSVRRQSLLLFLKQLNFPTKLFSLLQPRCILAQPGKYRDIRHDERPRLRRGHSSCRSYVPSNHSTAVLRPRCDAHRVCVIGPSARPLPSSSYTPAIPPCMTDCAPPCLARGGGEHQ